MYSINRVIKQILEDTGYAIGEYGAVRINNNFLGFIVDGEPIVNVRHHKNNARYQPRLIRILEEMEIKHGQYAAVSGLSGTKRRVTL
jgi:hypothetical protein